MSMKKKDMKEKCKEMLKKKTINTEEQDFLLELIKNHPEAKKKIGCGIKKFFIQKTMYGTNGFHLIRFDDTSTDFSYIQCFVKKNPLQDIKKACRSAIYEDMLNMRKEKDTVIHHNIISFDELFMDWYKENKHLNLCVNNGQDNSYETFFMDKFTTKSFRAYHQKEAILVELTKEQHKEIHAK